MANNINMQSKNILIIEDSPTQRAILANLTKELGLTPICPNQFDLSILDIINDKKIEIVLLDLILLDEDGHSVGDGFQICQQIKSLEQTIKVIVITAESDSAAKLFAESQGADGFLNKPFKIEDLENCIKNLS